MTRARKCDWEFLRGLSGMELLGGDIDILRTLGSQPGLLGDIYTQVQTATANFKKSRPKTDLVLLYTIC
jgi:hypothetical protein